MCGKNSRVLAWSGNLSFRNSAPHHPPRPPRPPRPPHSGNSIWMWPALQHRLFLPLPSPSIYPVVLRIHHDLSFTLRHFFSVNFFPTDLFNYDCWCLPSCLLAFVFAYLRAHLARIISLGPAAFRNTYFGFNIIGMHIYYPRELFLFCRTSRRIKPPLYCVAESAAASFPTRTSVFVSTIFVASKLTIRQSSATLVQTAVKR